MVVLLGKINDAIVFTENRRSARLYYLAPGSRVRATKLQDGHQVQEKLLARYLHVQDVNRCKSR